MSVLLVERRATTVILTMNRPRLRNALSTELMDAIIEAAERLSTDAQARVVVLTGADPAFSAGLDLNELSAEGSNLGRDPMSALRALPQVTIAAVNGPAITGGFELALACDIRIASERARFADTHARVGVLPGGGLSVILPRLAGAARAKELSLSGNFIDADTAAAWGVINRVVPHDSLLPAALGLAEAIAGNDPALVTTLRQTIDSRLELSLDAALADERRAFEEMRTEFQPQSVAARKEAVIRRGRELDRRTRP